MRPIVAFATGIRDFPVLAVAPQGSPRSTYRSVGPVLSGKQRAYRPVQLSVWTSRVRPARDARTGGSVTVMQSAGGLPACLLEVPTGETAMDTISVDLTTISAYGPARATIAGAPLSADELRATVTYWRATLYMSAAMIYLRDNPLLREPLKPEHVKRRLLGHWGSDPGLESRLRAPQPADQKIRPRHDLSRRSRARRAGVLSNLYLEGSYREIYPEITEDEDGLRRFFRQFSFPGGIGSHCTPETPGSIHEGGELGYSHVARLRRGLRQPGPDRHRDGGRRRGGDRAAGDLLALQQVPRTRFATARCCRCCI